MKQSFYILIGWMIMAYACDPCADCGEPLRYDPTVKMVFINQDSAGVLNDSIQFNKDSITTNTALRKVNTDSSRVLQDSLLIVDTLVAAGKEEYVEVQTRFNQTIDSLTIVSDSLSSYSKQLTAINTELTKILTVINKGTVQLQQTSILETGAALIYEDSMSSFRLPLLLASSQTSYQITIDGIDYAIAFTYETFESIDKARVAKVSAGNLAILSHSFDSLTLNCPSDCISDDATVIVYF
ncbi:hypothetical protein [Marinoscillum sp.]|uniref:hypothetical protein n=1 Tax=Marinoscillum sp. TaxID=2024838 RepID=UPI003BAB6B1C